MGLMISIIIALWVFLDAINKKIKYSWLYALGVIVFIFLGLPLYIARRQMKSEEKLLKKSIKYICIGLSCFALLASIFLVFKERTIYRCSTCFANKDKIEWRLGEWRRRSIAIFSYKETISETNFLKDFLVESGHHHEWEFAHGYPYYFLGTVKLKGGWDHGTGRHISEHAKEYGSNPNFRIFIHTKLKEGTLSKTKFLEYFYLRRFYDNPSLDKESQELLNEFSFIEEEVKFDNIANIAKKSNTELSKKYIYNYNFRVFIQTRNFNKPLSETVKLFSEPNSPEEAINLKIEINELLNSYQQVKLNCGEIE